MIVGTENGCPGSNASFHQQLNGRRNCSRHVCQYKDSLAYRDQRRGRRPGLDHLQVAEQVEVDLDLGQLLQVEQRTSEMK